MTHPDPRLCSHTKLVWVTPVQDPFDPDHEMEAGHWSSEGTFEDIDTGRFRCTQCREVFYYTGHWQEFHTGQRP